MNDSFSNTHPLVNLIFFATVLTFTMLILHPVCLMLSLLCAAVNAFAFGGKKTALFSLRFLLPTALFVVLINPLLNHRGATILTYLPWGNPLTLESLVYGCVTAALLCAVVLWFSSVNRVMTSDKLIYLFGRIAPSLGLVLTMALRFIPRFTAQFRQVWQAQRQIAGMEGKGPITRLKGLLKVFSVMISWSMENAIDTADSMKSRGYGLKGRTSFSLFRFTRRDGFILGVVLTETASLIALWIGGAIRFRYFPSIRGAVTDVYEILFYAVYTLLMLTPVILSAKEEFRWKRLQSNI